MENNEPPINYKDAQIEALRKQCEWLNHEVNHKNSHCELLEKEMAELKLININLIDQKDKAIKSLKTLIFMLENPTKEVKQFIDK
jgi:hypothetical protein